MKDLVVLEKINSPNFLKKLSILELKKLSSCVRAKIIDSLSSSGGHLSSNLGIIELTISIHRVFDSPIDKIVFDTGHQCYTHKILTGRFKYFSTLRQFDGLSGFLCPDESVHDHFYTGHAGNALSLAIGMAYARDLAGDDYYIVAVLGDATFSCGLTLEAINNISKKIKKLIVIINDNSMSISKSVGSISKIINNFRPESKNKKLDYFKIDENKISSFLFDHFGFKYFGPINGNNIKNVVKTLKLLKNHDSPVFLHVLTIKGLGLRAAELDPIKYHGAKPFDRITGEFNCSNNITFPKVFGKCLLEMGEKDKSLCVVTPAMDMGSSLVDFRKRFPDRFYDVGIAEGHAITFAAGLMSNRKTKVICCIYSTFIQRAFDNIFHDVCIQKIPILIAVDRSGISGGDGLTANGFYDISFLYSMPNLVIVQPRDGHVLEEIVNSDFVFKVPSVIRYSNISTNFSSKNHLKKRIIGDSELLRAGREIVIIGLGHMAYTAIEVAKKLEKNGLSAYVIDPVFISPLDTKVFSNSFLKGKIIVTIEDGLCKSGFAFIFNNYLIDKNISFKKILNFGVKDEVVRHGEYERIIRNLGLDSDSISKKILSDNDVSCHHNSSRLKHFNNSK